MIRLRFNEFVCHFKGIPGRDNFALLVYNKTYNLGDEIQSLAALQFLPQVDALVDRDALSEVSFDQPHKIILNGWYSHRPDQWPPAPSLQPLITSFHASHSIWAERNIKEIAFAKRVAEPDSLAYLTKHAPIGARDFHTRDLLEQNAVPSFFSACLTLTLTLKAPVVRRSYVCVNDLDDDVAEFVAHRSGRRVVRTQHDDYECNDPNERMQRALDLLSLYAHARYVITSRLHCALPCLALGTPVLFCPTAPDLYRFSGLLDLVRHCTTEQLLQGNAPFDFSNPDTNENTYQPLRNDLITRCKDFVENRG